MVTRLALSIFAMSALLLSCRSAPAPHYELPDTADLYVATDGSDKNDGRSPETALATITRASRLARPGYVVLVAEGEYSDPVVTTRDGRSDARIVYVSEKPGAARISARGARTAWANSGDFIDIIGFDISGSRYLGISNTGSYVHVRSNIVHDLEMPSCNQPNGGAGIVHGNYEAVGNATIGNIVHSIRAPGRCNLVHGIYHSNPHGVIQNNVVFDISDTGIHMWHAANAVTVANNLVWSAEVGILVGANDLVGDDYVITNNIVRNNGTGIREFGTEFGANNLYENNLVFENNRNFSLVSGSPRGNLEVDPAMVNFRLDGGGDYRLSASSPAIDAGTWAGAPDVDLVGVERPQGRAVDVGPFEFVVVELADSRAP